MRTTVIITGDDQIEEITVTFRQRRTAFRNQWAALNAGLKAAKQRWPNAKQRGVRLPDQPPKEFEI